MFLLFIVALLTGSNRILANLFFLPVLMCAALIRNAAITGFFLPSASYALVVIIVGVTTQLEQQQNAIVYMAMLVQELIPNSFLVLAAGAAETSRDARLLMSFVLLLGSFPFGRDLVLSVQLLIGYAVKLHMRRGRDFGIFSGAIAFMKFSELKRRREADKTFILNRRQDMHPDVFGDPTHARYIVVVSHPWLAPDHADPQGIHLDALVRIVVQKLSYVDARSAWRWWWQYYFLQSEGDVLIFFDMSSLHQPPRSIEQDDAFRKALAVMNFLYYSFDVLVIRDLPGDVPEFGLYGIHVSFLDRGWCWAEASIAFLGSQLQRFSEEIIEELATDQRKQKHRGTALLSHHTNHLSKVSTKNWQPVSWSDSLLGVPNYPPELMQRGKECELLAFRNEQIVQGKIFTNGKHDVPRVAKILAKVEGLQRFRSHLQRGDVEAVVGFFRDPTFFEQSGFSREDVSNVVFDGMFTSPLHVAVDRGNEEIVKILIAQGARPCRNFLGHWPWEGWLGLPRRSAAAVASSMPPSAFLALPNARDEATFASASHPLASRQREEYDRSRTFASGSHPLQEVELF